MVAGIAKAHLHGVCFFDHVLSQLPTSALRVERVALRDRRDDEDDREADAYVVRHVVLALQISMLAVGQRHTAFAGAATPAVPIVCHRVPLIAWAAQMSEDEKSQYIDMEETYIRTRANNYLKRGLGEAQKEY